MKKILLIDGNSILNRTFYATMNVLLKSPKGVYTNAIYGFLNILFLQIEEENPTHIAVAFDLKAPTKRHEMYKEYKGGRHKMPTELNEQFPYLKQILRAMNIAVLENPGDEADDILGSIAKQFTKVDEDVKVCALTGDRDYFQLVDEKIYIKYPKTTKGKTDYLIYDENRIMEEYGLPPIKLIEIKALMGDASDNIPGVKGIGEKTAIKLIQEYSTVEKLYKSIDENNTTVKGKTLEKLIEDKEMAFLSKKLGRINIGIDLKEVFKIESENEKDLKYSGWKNREVYEIFKELNLKTLIQKYNLDTISEDGSEEIKLSVIEKEKQNEEKLKGKSAREIYELLINSEIGSENIKKHIENIKYIENSKDIEENNSNIQIYSYNESVEEKIYNQFKKQIENIRIQIKEKKDEKKSKVKVEEQKVEEQENKSREEIQKEDLDIYNENFSDKQDNLKIYISFIYSKYILPTTNMDGENISQKLIKNNLKESDKDISKIDEYILKNIFIEDEFIENTLIREYYGSISKQKTKYANILINEKDKTYIYTYDIDKIKNVLEDENIPKVGHGFKKFKVEAKENGFDINFMDYDTKIAGYLIDSSLNQYDIITQSKRELDLDIEELIEENLYFRNYYDLEVKQDKKDIVKLRKLLESLKVLDLGENNVSDYNFLDKYFENEAKDKDKDKNKNKNSIKEKNTLKISYENIIKIFNNIIGEVPEIEQEQKEKTLRNIEKFLKNSFNLEVKNNLAYLEIENLENEMLQINITKKKKEQILDVLNIIIRKILSKKRINQIKEEKNVLPLIIYFEYLKTKEELKKITNIKLFKDIEMKTVELLAELQYNGVYLDTKYLNKFIDKIQIKIDETESNILKYSKEPINVNSPKQLGTLLYEELELPVIKKNKTGYATDVDTLKKLEDKHEIISYILEYRELNKLKSTYGQTLIDMVNTKTNRIHSNFRQTITATGRLSSQEPNLQNIPTKTELGQEIRRAFIPKEGYIYLDADYSQIELRILADMSSDEAMQKAFKENKDIHKSTASNIFNIPEENVTKEIRSYAKAVNFGIIYGISDYGLSEATKLSVKEAKKYIEKYLTHYFKINEYMNELKQKAKEDGYVETKYMRRRYTKQAQSPNYILRQQGYRIAMNAPIQGTAADIMKIAIYNVYNKLKAKKLESRVVLQVHDEIIIETKENEKTIVEKILKEEMENAAKLSVKLEVEVGSGNNWQDAKK